MSKNSIFKGALTLSLSMLAVKIVGVFYKIPLAYLLGEGGMGYFNTAYSIYGVFYILSSAGIPKAVAMYIAENTAREDADTLRATCLILIKRFARLGVAVMLMLIILSKPLSLLTSNSKSLATILAIAPSILFVTAGGVIRGYLTGHSKFGSIAISQLIEVLSKLIIGLAFALLGTYLALELSIVAALSILGITLGSIFSYIYMYRACFRENSGKLTQNASICTSSIAKSIFIRSMPITASAAIVAISNALDAPLVMRGLKNLGYSEEYANAIYGNYSTLSVPMISLAASLLLPISLALLPQFAITANDGKEFSKIFKKATILISAVASPAVLIYALYSFEILDLLFSAPQAATGAETLLYVSLSALLLPMLNLSNTALEASARTTSALISLALGLIVKLVSCTLLTLSPEYAFSGIAIATTLSYSVSLSFSLISLGKSVCVRGALLTLVVNMALSTLIYAPWFIWFYKVNPTGNSLFTLLIAVLVPSLIYVGAVSVMYYRHEVKALWQRFAQI